jgi:phage-related minor tail protein
MKDFTQATADFARLGYDLDEASSLAEAANVYMNVGDGIDNVEDASKSIISTMKAFSIEAEGAMGIVDRFNEVGKLLPVDNYVG